MKAGAATWEVDTVGMANAPATFRASVSSKSRITIRAVCVQLAGLERDVQVREVVAGGDDHGLGLADAGLLEDRGHAAHCPG